MNFRTFSLVCILPLGACVAALERPDAVPERAATRARGPNPSDQAPQETEPSSLFPSWEYELAPELWFVQASGEQTLGGLSAPVDVEFGDGNLGYGLQFAAHRDRWGVLAEALYVDAEGTTFDATGTQTTSEIEQLLLEADVTYRLSEDGPFEFLGGLRYNRFDNSIAVAGGPSASAREGWLDPILGARLATQIAGSWSFVWRLDFGGFRFGSEFSWNTVAGIRFRPSDSWFLDLSYRVLDVDYEDSDFAYDVQTSGALLNVGLRW